MPEENEFGQRVGDLRARLDDKAAAEPVRSRAGTSPSSRSGPRTRPLYAALGNPGDEPLWTYRATDMPGDLEDMTALVARTLVTPDLLTFALVPAGRRAEGIASYTRIDPATGQVEVAGVLFARRCSARAATEAIHLLMRHAFDDLGYRRFEWKCDSLNEPSRRAAARLGFTWEGRFRHTWSPRAATATRTGSRSPTREWPAVRAEHERWLDPANFDADGRQPVSPARADPSRTQVREWTSGSAS